MDKTVKFLRLDRQYAGLKEEILPAIDKVLSGGKVLQSVEVENFENIIKQVHGLPFAAAVSCGTDAISFSLKAAGIKPGDRVAVTSLSFIASASSIVNAGGIPVFTDIDPDTYLMDMEKACSLVDSGKVSGVLAVHLYGQMLDVRELYKRTQKKGLFLVEDAAQCLGATCSGYSPGTHSDAACVSFDPMKVIGAYGSGGMVVTRREDIFRAVRELRYHGQREKLSYEIVGYNSQMPAIQAEILRIKTKYLAEWENKRLATAEFYKKALGSTGFVKLPAVLPGNKHIFHKFVIRAERRDGLAKHLSDNGVETAVHYRLPMFAQKNMRPYYSEEYGPYRVNDIVKNIISLPVYPELEKEEAEYVCGKIKDFYA